jgi:putative phage-type endonuclease
MLLSDLDELEDILDNLVFEDEPTIFNENNTLELMETALHLMEEYMTENPTAITEPDFQEILLEEIQDIFYIQLEEDILGSDFIEDDMNDLLEEACYIFITTFCAERSITENNTGIKIENRDKYNMMELKIQHLRGMPQHTQRTPEWYQFRWNLITASSAWKAFESQSMINQLIYEKCQPLKNECQDPDEIKMVNTNSALHWGNKYEPLSVLIYENKYNTKVEDFGCIQHPVYTFIGASPDGIITDDQSDRYGRMLEIKNVVSREINGIPKKEYWIQMQFQMEVCDLDECDFLETKFTEYIDYKSYVDDSNKWYEDDEGIEVLNMCLSKDAKMKGCMIYFNTKEGTPFYIYKPLDIIHPHDIEEWLGYNVEYYQYQPEFNYTYIKTIYWKLETLSCVLVLRNREWFKNNVSQLEKVWKIIEEERITGYQHRAPVKKQKKETSVMPETHGCLLPFKKAMPTSSYLKVDKVD